MRHRRQRRASVRPPPPPCIHTTTTHARTARVCVTGDRVPSVCARIAAYGSPHAPRVATRCGTRDSCPPATSPSWRPPAAAACARSRRGFGTSPCVAATSWRLGGCGAGGLATWCVRAPGCGRRACAAAARGQLWRPQPTQRGRACAPQVHTDDDPAPVPEEATADGRSCKSDGGASSEPVATRSGGRAATSSRGSQRAAPPRRYKVLFPEHNRQEVWFQAEEQDGSGPHLRPHLRFDSKQNVWMRKVATSEASQTLLLRSDSSQFRSAISSVPPVRRACAHGCQPRLVLALPATRR